MSLYLPFLFVRLHLVWRVPLGGGSLNMSCTLVLGVFCSSTFHGAGGVGSLLKLLGLLQWSSKYGSFCFPFLRWFLYCSVSRSIRKNCSRNLWWT